MDNEFTNEYLETIGVIKRSQFSIKSVNTYFANLYIGLRSGYSNKTYSCDFAKSIIKNYCDNKKIAVTVTKTEYIYVNGHEKGIIVGFINYPRFPSSQKEIKDSAMELAYILLIKLEQIRCSIQFPNETIMLTNTEHSMYQE